MRSSPAVVRTSTSVTRSPRDSADTARPVMVRAPACTAASRMPASNVSRGIAPPKLGNEPPGQGRYNSRPNPAARRPQFRVGPTQSSMPRWSSSAIARGVRPSPQGLSRGNVAASARRTSIPARARPIAAADPAGPAPTTRTSQRWSGAVTCTLWGRQPSAATARHRLSERRRAEAEWCCADPMDFPARFAAKDHLGVRAAPRHASEGGPVEESERYGQGEGSCVAARAHSAGLVGLWRGHLGG